MVVVILAVGVAAVALELVVKLAVAATEEAIVDSAAASIHDIR